MTKINSSWMVLAACFSSVSLMGSGSRAASAQQIDGKTPALSAGGMQPRTSKKPEEKPTAASAKPVEEEETSSADAPNSQGIKIHGHWVLKVSNPDGTTVERREFNNSLVTTYTTSQGQIVTNSGSTMVALALSGNVSMGNPGIGFVQGSLTGSPDTWCAQNLAATPQGISCFVYTSTNSLWNVGANYFGLTGAGQQYTQLGLSISAGYTPTANMVLTGNFTVPAGLTQVTAVQTLFGGCTPTGTPGNNNLFPATFSGSGTVRNADMSPSSCTASTMYGNPAAEDVILGALTSTPVQNSNGVATPLTVTPGQVITVTVTLSFS